MSHLVSPSAYRLGRTQVWGNITSSILESLTWKSYFSYPVGFIKKSTALGDRLYLLYYPIFSILRYRNRFMYPRFYRHLRFLVWVRSMSFSDVGVSLNSIWTRALYRFTNRFTIRRRRLEWREWFKAVMVRGVGNIVKLPISVSGREWSVAGQRRDSPKLALQRIQKLVAIGLRKFDNSIKIGRPFQGVTMDKRLQGAENQVPRLVASFIYTLKALGPSWLRTLRQEITSGQKLDSIASNPASTKGPRRRFGTSDLTAKSFSHSKYRISNALLSLVVSRELRAPIQVIAMNVFQYLILKKITLPKNYIAHLDHLMNHRTRRDQHLYNTYFDILNILFLQLKFANIEWIFLRVIKHTLFKMHRRNVKLKYFLRFIHNAMRIIGQMDRSLSVFRLVVHGKIKGGTHRTKTFTAGYGKPPLNSIGFDIRYCFDNIYSKYGEYGMHLIVGRRFYIEDSNDSAL